MLERSQRLSPFLHHRRQHTNTWSILHRTSGVILSVCCLVLACWLMAIAEGPVACTHFVDAPEQRTVFAPRNRATIGARSSPERGKDPTRHGLIRDGNWAGRAVEVSDCAHISVPTPRVLREDQLNKRRAVWKVN